MEYKRLPLQLCLDTKKNLTNTHMRRGKRRVKSIIVFPLVWVVVFGAWYFLSGYLLARDAELYQALRDRGEPVPALVVDRKETRRNPGKSDERMEYALGLRIKVSSGQSSDVKLGVNKDKYDSQPQDSTIPVVAVRDEPARYMLQEDYDRHGPDGMRSDASNFRWLGGLLVSTMIAGLVVAFRKKPQPA